MRFPVLKEGVTYTQVSAGESLTVLLRSDGTAIACGTDSGAEVIIPALEEGVTYTQVSTSGDLTILLRSDGTAISFGEDISIPVLEEGVTYTQVSAGQHHALLHRSDGTAVAGGQVICGVGCPIVPALREGVYYIAWKQPDLVVQLSIGEGNKGQISGPPMF